MPMRYVKQVFSSFSVINRRSTRLLTTAEAKMSSDFTVKHDAGEKNGEFYIDIADGHPESRAVLQYEWLENKVLNFYHTEVPPVFRGKGIAKILAENALNFAVHQDAKFIPSCSYVEKYVRDINPKPEFTNLVTK